MASSSKHICAACYLTPKLIVENHFEYMVAEVLVWNQATPGRSIDIETRKLMQKRTTEYDATYDFVHVTSAPLQTPRAPTLKVISHPTFTARFFFCMISYVSWSIYYQQTQNPSIFQTSTPPPSALRTTAVSELPPSPLLNTPQPSRSAGEEPFSHSTTSAYLLTSSRQSATLAVVFSLSKEHLQSGTVLDRHRSRSLLLFIEWRLIHNSFVRLDT